MGRSLPCLAMLAALGLAEVARAHGEPAAAHSIVASDAQGALLVRLTEGLAVRTERGFRFVCPAAWGEDFIAAALSIPGGPAIVGATNGLFVVDRRGVVSAHSDASAAGPIAALTASDRALFALQSEAGRQRVVQVDAERVRAMWSSDQRWSEIVASGDVVHLVRLEGSDVHVARLSADGELLSEVKATLDDAASAVRAVVAGDTLYVIAVLPSLDYVLGRIEEGAWLPLHSARLIAGPIELTSGERYVALDGQLARFDEERVAPLDAADFVTCLRTHSGLSYACSNGGLKVVDADGLGRSLFANAQVVEPELESVPSEQRELCVLQWQRYAVDLLATGIDVAVQDAGRSSDDGGAHDSGLEDAGPAASTSCTVGSKSSFGAAWLALVLALHRRRCVLRLDTASAKLRA